MKLHRYFLSFIALLVVLIVANLVWARQQRVQAEARARDSRELVRHLGLTDLAVWSEARYTRHPSQADLFTPFQEFPGSLEHFPAGSLIAPPPRNATTTLTVRRGESL